MLKVLIGTDWKQNKEKILSMVSQDVQNQYSGRILMVPELVSHQTERDLCTVAGDTASRFAEVLTFSRLATRVADYNRIALPHCLDKGGRVVAMAAATRQLHSKLKAYAAVETRPEFLLGMLDAVDEFKRCCISAADLMFASTQTEGSLAQKLEELSLILEAYDSICARGKMDPRDQMAWLLDVLEDSDFAQGHVFYFDAFPDFSRQHLGIVYHMILHCPEVVISFNCDKPGSELMGFEKSGETALEIINFAKRNGICVEITYVKSEDSVLQAVSNTVLQGHINEGFARDYVHAYVSEGIYSECSSVVEMISKLTREGCRYRDIHVVCPDIQSYSGPISSVMERGHIPMYLSGTEDILDKTVIHTVLTAIEAALSGFAQKDVLRYMKSLLSPVSAELCDQIENYALLWSIDGSQWLDSWENHPRGLGEAWMDHDRATLEKIVAGKDSALLPLVHLRDGFRKAVGVPNQVEAVYNFLLEIKLDRRLKQTAQQMEEKGDNRNAQILDQLWEILINALEQLHQILGETSWDGDTFTRLLKLLLSQYDVGTIPSTLDAVSVGSVSAMRCHSCKYLFILGASEGVFPSYGSASGVLTDQERLVLQKLGVPVNPGAIEGLQTQFSEIQEVCCSATKAIYAFCSDGQPSFVYKRLKLMAGDEQTANGIYGAAVADPFEAAAYLACNNDEAAALQLQVHSQYETICTGRAHTLGKVEHQHIKALYGDTLLLSASQVDRLAECRLSYFLRYGIRVKERKAAGIDPAEFGTYVHAVLEECGRTIVEKGGFKNISLEDTLALAAEYSAKYFAERFSQINTQRLSYHFNKNATEVQLIVKELWEEMQESQFQPTDFELSFADNGQMPAVNISGSVLSAKLRGFVDRVDIYKEGNTSYVRVVDYKTGKKDFDYCDVFNGIGLQMLLYLFALEDGGEEHFKAPLKVAGVQYFPARVPLVASRGLLTPEQAALEHSKTFKRQGLLLLDERILAAMEPSENPKRMCYTRRKDGSISGYLASSKQFRQLKSYIFHLLRQIVDDISSGNVTPNPYTRGSSHNACTFCPYGAVCHPQQIEGRRNYQKMEADRFWEEIERKEAQSNG